MDTITYFQPFFPLFLALTTVSALISRGRRGRRLLMISAICLFLFSWRPAAWAVLWFFEHPYRSVAEAPPEGKDIEAIVVLASSVIPASPPLPTAFLGADTTSRCLYGAWLHLHWHAVPVLASGGGSLGIDASLMRQAIEREGVPADMVWTEERSRSTYESAVESARLLKRKGIHRIALVTEAYHMPRSERCFRKQGLDVVPVPCGFRSVIHGHLSELFPNSEVVEWNEDTMHEAVGLVWYALKGRI